MRISVRVMEGLLVVLVSCLVTAAAQNQEQASQRFFIKNYSTTTETSLSVITSVVPYICFLTGAMPSACTGRSLRRSRKVWLNLENSASVPRLDAAVLSSDVASFGPGEMVDEDPTAKEKFFFTVYRSVTSVVTVTTTSTNISTTVSVSAMCTYAGFTGPVC
ncbi:uncharacterized protein [Cherax quadricarinatus]|uniref:uncharacterized protein n=1 Tax=Cherax quadricarinatus TaxID=27406 RepID=UPI00387EB026